MQTKNMMLRNVRTSLPSDFISATDTVSPYQELRLLILAPQRPFFYPILSSGVFKSCSKGFTYLQQ